MKRQLVFVAVTVALLLVGSHAQGAPREGGGNAAARKPERNESNSVAGARAHEPRGGQAPGGAWSERSHHAGQTAGPGAHGAAASPGGSNAAKLKQKSTSSGTAGSSGQAATKRGSSSGTAEKAAGAAAVKRNSPQGAGATNGAPGVDTSTTSASQASANRNHDHAAGAAAVRHAYNNHGLYGQGWFGAHPGAWAPVGIAAGALWAPTTYGAVAGYCGMGATPVSYNYGNNVTYQVGQIMVDGQSVGTAGEFSQQAADLAQRGASADAANSGDWLPLGVFAMVRNEQQQPQLILQMAVNKQGILRGNYTDEVSEHTQPIQGSVDPKTQRAAWTVGDNASSVMEAGLSNLVEGEAPALIHKNGKTDHWLLVRLEQPKAGDDAAGTAAQP